MKSSVLKYPWGTESTALNDSQPTKLSERVLNDIGAWELVGSEVQYRVSPIDLICRAVNQSSIPLLRILICNNYLFIRCIHKNINFPNFGNASHAHRRMNVER